MVKVKPSSEYEQLETLITDLCARHGYKLFTTGWTRKTFDVFREDRAANRLELLARIESLATSNGEIQLYDDRATEFATELGTALEQTFAISEAVLVRAKRPN
jgi:hypothetical protein